MTDHSGFEPRLGGPLARLSSYEPLLGGKRKPGADLGRIRRILNAHDSIELRDALENVLRFNHMTLYARELAQIVPPRARHQVGGYRTSFTASQRVNALEALSLIGGVESLLPLLETLDDPAYQVREAARETLSTICRRLDPGDEKTALAYVAFIDALALLPTVGRRVVVNLLGEAPSDLVFGPLIRRGLVAQESHVRRESARLLGQIGDKRATKSLMATLGDPSAPVRGVSAWALGRMPTEAVVKPLIETLSSDTDANVRAAAAEALGRRAEALFVEDRPVEMIVDALAGALRETEPIVSTEAYLVLVSLNNPASREALLRYQQEQQARGAAGR